MFRKILVANRGEIAVRIMRTCREMGIATVAVHSEADRSALHLQTADEAIFIGDSEPRESYLNIEKIIAAARQSGAEAIHPGYGFLAENGAFAEACEAEGLRFIGPPAAVIRSLGDKTTARTLMLNSAVPVIPGMTETEENLADLAGQAREIGYPVLLKAAAGGGGKGMRVVANPEKLKEAFDEAASEAQNAFGNGAVYLEKYLERPRHVEIQILADMHGHIIHLGERECSLQRRHQKIIEEAPAPGISQRALTRIGERCADACRRIAYRGAGTFEFLMDGDGKFYFMETNTRLQVEHGVTELVTGIDIVKEQIRIAAGERLSFRQGDITFSGHALECRVNAEDPVTFVPSPGTIHAFSVAGGPGVRVDTAMHAEATVTPYYDSMIAKVLTYGRDRDEAIARMRRTLEMTVIEGIKTSIPMQLRILADPDFQAGRLSTGFMDRFLPPAKPEKMAESA